MTSASLSLQQKEMEEKLSILTRMVILVKVSGNNLSIHIVNTKLMGGTPASDDYGVRGQFLYADYTPLEDNRNAVEMVKSFVSLAADLTKLRTSKASLSSLLHDSDSLRDDVIAAIKQIKSQTATSIENYRDRNSDALVTELHAEGSSLLRETQTELLALLGSADTTFTEKHQRYKESIIRKMKENDERAVALVNEWLSKDYLNLPQPVVSNLHVNVVATLSPSFENYDIQRSTSSVLRKTAAGEEKDALAFSYIARIESRELEFWNYKRKVSELGIRDLMLPIGLKQSISEKLKQTFKFGQGDSELVKEPAFARVDDYYIARIEMRDQKSLTAWLAADPTRTDSTLFDISYPIDNVSGQHSPGRPQINYRTMENGQAAETIDLLQMTEIEKMSDISKIRLLGSAIMSKAAMLTDRGTITSRSRLESLKIGDAEIIAKEKVDYDYLFDFLDLVASNMRAILDKLRDKTPVKDELIVRQEIPGGQRREFTIRLENLKSQLANEQYGRPLLKSLGI